MRRASTAGLIVLVIASAAQAGELHLTPWGPSHSQGALVTYPPAPTAPAFDPARPTIVLVHGLNPFHPWRHFDYADAVGPALASRYGGVPNVLGWDWNAATMAGVRLRTLDRNAIEQGQRLADALIRSGIDPERVHLVGHSHGGLVVASAALTLWQRTGRYTARLTFVDPIPPHHRELFEVLHATRVARRVENVWADSPSGFGRPACYPGVVNLRVPATAGLLGYLRPLHVDHFHAMQDYLVTGL